MLSKKGAQLPPELLHRVRTRVCGIAVEGDKILMVKHEPLGPKGFLWSPPGGGVEFGVSLTDQLIKEFEEETGLHVQVGEFLFVNEYLNEPIHAIEVFYKINTSTGELKTGHDPELPMADQMIKEVKYLSFSEIKNMDPLTVHNSFRHCSNIDQLLNLKGYFKFQNI